MGVQRQHVNELCNDRRKVTAATALILARVFGNSPNFWLNAQKRSDLWEAMHSPRERERIKRARPCSCRLSSPRIGVAWSHEANRVTHRHHLNYELGFKQIYGCHVDGYKTESCED
ncbi:MAG: HigA family addiction module antitoxin [Woeseiaceae bacterium]|nr:HigA family addiction module antitoxin [Woeseiaceae bacterium]